MPSTTHHAGSRPAALPPGRADGGDRRLLAAVAAVSVLTRLLPVLRGGGLGGMVSYDGSVYYGAAAGLAHGLLPYRDLLLLHPPGILIALLPFALLGRVIGDPHGLVLARLAFVALGAANAVLVARILRPQGRGAAAVGGLFYAAFLPAVFVERATSLEPLATVCLLSAVLLLTRPLPAAEPLRAPVPLLAGVLLGFSCGVKIWGVAVALSVVLWCRAGLGRRLALLTAAGTAIGATALCLPFLLAAPGPMTRMVVLDQLGRRRAPQTLVDRLDDLTGVPGFGTASGAGTVRTALLGAALLLAVGCVLLALCSRTGRLGVAVLATCTALLLLTPPWFAHYAGLSAPAAVVVGAAAGTVATLGPRRLGLLLLTAAVVAVLGGGALTASTQRFGVPFPGQGMAAAAAALPGCVTTDDVTVLIESNLLQRNLTRGCPLVVDLGGYSYDEASRAGDRLARASNAEWQRQALAYLGSGSGALIRRFHRGSGFSTRTASTVTRWPVIARVRGYLVHRPAPSPS